MRLAKAQHRADEILAVDAEDPRDAHDEAAPEYRADGLLAHELRLSVDIRRSLWSIRLIRLRAIPREDVIRADVDHLRAELAAELGKVRRARCIDGHAGRLIILRPVHRRVGRTVNDACRLVDGHIAAHRLRIRQGEFPARHALHFNASILQLQDTIVPELSRYTRDKYPHPHERSFHSSNLSFFLYDSRWFLTLFFPERLTSCFNCTKVHKFSTLVV